MQMTDLWWTATDSVEGMHQEQRCDILFARVIQHDCSTLNVNTYNRRGLYAFSADLRMPRYQSQLDRLLPARCVLEATRYTASQRRELRQNRREVLLDVAELPNLSKVMHKR